MPACGEYALNATPDHVLHLRLGDVPVTVRTDCAELHSLLGRYFEQFAVSSPSDEGRLVCAFLGSLDIDDARLVDVPRRGGRPSKEAYYDTHQGRVIVKKRTGMVIVSDGPTRIVVGDVIANANQVINAVEQVFIEEYVDRNYWLLHAAAVAHSQDLGVLIASPSGVGKSSAALASVGVGFKFMSNDRVLVALTDVGAHLVGVPKKPRINPGTALALPILHELLSHAERERCAEMTTDALWNLESKLDVDVEKVFGTGTTLLEADLRLVFLLAWNPHGGETVFHELGDDEAVAQLMQHLVPEGPYRAVSHPLPDESTVRAALRRSRCYRVTGGVRLERFASFAAAAAGSLR